MENDASIASVTITKNKDAKKLHAKVEKHTQKTEVRSTLHLSHLSFYQAMR